MPRTNAQDIFTDFDNHAQAYHTYVRACCHTMGLADHEIEDVSANVLTQAYRGLPGYLGQASFKTWLWRITRNEVVNHFRQHSRYARVYEHDPRHKEPQPGVDPCDLIIHKESLHLLHQAIAKLPPAWARVIQLFYWQHQSTPAIARTLNCSPQLVRTTLFRARRQLKVALAS